MLPLELNLSEPGGGTNGTSSNPSFDKFWLENDSKSWTFSGTVISDGDRTISCGDDGVDEPEFTFSDSKSPRF